MAATKDQILESISNMTVMEVVELISEMEEKFGSDFSPSPYLEKVVNEKINLFG